MGTTVGSDVDGAASRYLARLDAALQSAVQDYRNAERRVNAGVDDVRGRSRHYAAQYVYGLCRLIQAARAIDAAAWRFCSAADFLGARGVSW
jgi:hypothetical protein